MTDQKVRWGFLSTANIGRKNWKGIKLSGNGVIAGVASRSVEKAQAYIDECQAEAPFETPPKAYGTYEELLADPNIDAVYVPVPTGIRKEWVIKAAEAGKHVMGEKPAGVDAAEVEAMLAACRKHNVHYMDGVMFVHTERLQQVKEAAKDATKVGDLRRISCAFNFCAPDDFLKNDIRLNSDLEPLGCLGDVGWYTIRVILEIMDGKLPHTVRATMLSEAKRDDSPDTVPTELSAELLFDGGVSASYYCSFVTEMQQWVMVAGTKGYLHIPDFVLPHYGYESEFFLNQAEFNTYGCDFNMENYQQRFTCREYSNGRAISQEVNMVRTFADQVLKGTPDASWGDMTLKNQQIMDASLASARNGGEPVTL